MRLPVFASIVATPSASCRSPAPCTTPTRLLGHDGFVGVKTGSDNAAGGCFAFRAIRWIDGKRTTITGVVLGQPGHDQIAAGLVAADAMVDRITGQRARQIQAAAFATAVCAAEASIRGRASIARHTVGRNHEENTLAARRSSPCSP